MDLHPVPRLEGSGRIAGLAFHPEGDLVVIRHLDFHGGIGLEVNFLVGAVNAQGEGVLAHRHHLAPLEVGSGLEVEPSGLVEIAPQVRPDGLGESGCIHHATVDPAHRSELENPLVARVAHFGMATTAAA